MGKRAVLSRNTLDWGWIITCAKRSEIVVYPETRKSMIFRTREAARKHARKMRLEHYETVKVAIVPFNFGK